MVLKIYINQKQNSIIKLGVQEWKSLKHSG